MNGATPLTRQEYSRIIQHKKELSAFSLLSLAQELELNPTSIFSGDISIEALDAARRGNHSFIDPRYTVGASSRKFTVINTLNYLSKYRGPHLRKAVNQHFQIHEDFWSDWRIASSQCVNIRLMAELRGVLRKNGFTDLDFRAIGFHSSITLRETQIGKALSAADGKIEAFELMFNELAAHFEKNHLYQIESINKERCIVRSVNNPDISDALSTRLVGNPETCLVRVGIFSAVPTLQSESAASVHQTHCVHAGDPHCRFIIDYSSVRSTRGQLSRLTLLT
jgi:predicted hydrocarbon binding protein